MDLFLAAVLSASPRSYIPPSAAVAQSSSLISVVAPTRPYTPPDSRVDLKPPINIPQTSPTRDSSESWEQKMLRRYGRKVT